MTIAATSSSRRGCTVGLPTAASRNPLKQAYVAGGHHYKARILFLVAAVLTLAPAATAGGWKQHPGPILVPTQAWEDETVQEPTVLYDKDARLYRMWYTGGYSGENALGYATSRDGIHWGKYSRNPVLGQGGSGLPGNAAHFSVMRHAGLYYAFYNYGYSINVATSKDGKHWTPRAQPVLYGDWNSGWANAHCNTFAWVDAKGWHMLFDTMNRESGAWVMGLAHGRSPFSFAIDPFGPLYSLRARPDQVTFGGPWLTHTKGGYELHYILSTGNWNIPSVVYRATSSDLYHWRPDAKPALTMDQPWQADQVADPSIANGMLFFDGLDNTDLVKIRSVIGVAVR